MPLNSNTDGKNPTAPGSGKRWEGRNSPGSSGRARPCEYSVAWDAIHLRVQTNEESTSLYQNRTAVSQTNLIWAKASVHEVRNRVSSGR